MKKFLKKYLMKWLFAGNLCHTTNGLPWSNTIEIKLKPFSQYFEQTGRLLDDYFIFLIKIGKIKWVARYFKWYQSNNEIYLEKRNTKLPFLSFSHFMMINKDGKKLFLEICSKATDSKRYIFFNTLSKALLKKTFHF